MSFVGKVAYDQGSVSALASFGLTKEAGVFGTLGRFAAKGMKWGGRALGTAVPLVGNAAGAALSGVGGAIEGFANGEGLQGAALRAGTQAAASALPLGASIAAGMAGDHLADTLAAKRRAAPGPQHAPMPGMMNPMNHQGHLPGYVQ